MNQEKPPRLLDQLRGELRARHMSRRTEKSFVFYGKKLILFHNKCHPRDKGIDHIRAYLSHLARERNVAVSIQNVALSALLFLYREVLRIDLSNINSLPRTRLTSSAHSVLTH